MCGDDHGVAALVTDVPEFLERVHLPGVPVDPEHQWLLLELRHHRVRHRQPVERLRLDLNRTVTEEQILDDGCSHKERKGLGWICI